MAWFKDYRDSFEEVVIEGVRLGMLGMEKSIPITPGKLSRKQIGRVMGSEIATDKSVVIDYYGYMKKSRGFNLAVAAAVRTFSGKQVKMVNTTVVHFNSIRLEIIAKIAPSLVANFGNFKKTILDVRQFKHDYKV